MKPIQFDSSMIDVVESHIRPPLTNVITLPVRGEPLAVYITQSSWHEGDESERCKEIACLIAVAPKLLDSLEEVIALWWKEFTDFFGGDPEVDEQNRQDFESQPAIIKARAIIAKANPQRAATPGRARRRITQGRLNE